VNCKTAVLISAACQAGAILGKVSAEMENALSDFGMDLGIAFQLMDDVLDYAADQEEFGKSIGHDIEEGKITLPLIHALNHSTDAEKSRIGDIVSAETVEDEDFAFAFDLVHRHRGIEYTVSRACEYVERAKASLKPFPQSKIKSALFELSDYVVTRQR
jgi:octaprenyl-diphosphate synthase